VRLERRTAQVPSRAAENLFWLGRYAERLEDTTRLLRTALARLVGEGTSAEETELSTIALWLAKLDLLPPRFEGRTSRHELTRALGDAVFGQSQPGRVRELLRRVSYLTARVRDRLSGDTWRILNQLQTEFPAKPQPATPVAMITALHKLVFQLAALSGMELENMIRGHAWRFLDIGRRIERGRNLLAAVRAAVIADPEEQTVLAPLLEYTDSSMGYRRYYFARPEFPTTLDFLLVEEGNPRALAFQIKAVGHHLGRLPGCSEDSEERRKFHELSDALKGANVHELGLAAREGSPQALDDLLKVLSTGFWDLSDLVTAHYFSHVFVQAS
jgi:uncharacterized alpha-E superfamily protein